MSDFEPKPTKPTGPWWAPEAWKGRYFPQVGDFFLLTLNTHPVGCARVNKNSCGVWIDGICKNEHFTDEKVIPSETQGFFIGGITSCKLVLMDPPSGDCDSKPCLCWNMSLWEKNHPEYADMPELEDEDEMPELEICNDAVKYHNDRLNIPEKRVDANSPPEKLVGHRVYDEPEQFVGSPETQDPAHAVLTPGRVAVDSVVTEPEDSDDV